MKDSGLDWAARVKIAVGIARALAHLQDGSEKPSIVHQDFKTSTVLLDTDFTPKVSEYGLCKLATDQGDAHCSTRILGAFGSVAPEYIMTGLCDERSVVYTFGVLLLELMTGRKPVDMRQAVGQQSLVTWVSVNSHVFDPA